MTTSPLTANVVVPAAVSLGGPFLTPNPAGEVTLTIPLQITLRFPTAPVPALASPTPLPAQVAAMAPAAMPGPVPAVAPQPAPPTKVGSPDLLERTGFDLDLAIFLAQASQAAYAVGPAAEAWGAAQGFDTNHAFDRGNIQGFWCAKDGLALLVFRGTSNPAQWLRDARFIPVLHPWGLVHVGFRDGITAVEPDLAEFDAIARTARRIWITGHSLGGALAVMAAARFKLNNLDKPFSTYTYGQPRVGFFNFADQFGLQLPGELLRFVNQSDIVTRVPPGLLYQHCGSVKRIVRPGELASIAAGTPGALSMTAPVPSSQPQVLEHDAPPCSEQEFAQLQATLEQASAAPTVQGIDLIGAVPYFKDHYITEYIRLLSDLRSGGAGS